MHGSIMVMDAAEYYEIIQALPKYSSGLPLLNILLDGGFQSGLAYHIFGNGEIFRELLHRTAFQISWAQLLHDPPMLTPIYYIDGRNHFSPYLLSKLAINAHISPAEILNHIQVARAFTWNQLTEMLADNIPKIYCSTVLVDGWTNFLMDPTEIAQKNRNPNLNPTVPAMDPKFFHDLNKMIDGLKSVLKNPAPLIITTGAMHQTSLSKTLGGNLVRHFSMVVIEIIETPNQITFKLMKHPFLAERNIEIPIPKDSVPVRMKAKYKKAEIHLNERLDRYLKRRKNFYSLIPLKAELDGQFMATFN